MTPPAEHPMPHSTPISRLRQRLSQALSPTELRIDDDSANHAGHPGARQGGHYRVFIVSEAFTGRPLIARHRMVYQAVAENLQSEVHALSIVAKSPAEVAPAQVARDAHDTSGDADED